MRVMVLVLVLNIRATASIGAPSQSAARIKACFSLEIRFFILTVERIRIYSIRVNRKNTYFFKCEGINEAANGRALAESQREKRRLL